MVRSPVVVDARPWPISVGWGIRVWRSSQMALDPESFQRRSPKQSRSRATWDAILEAASQILERDGPAGFNTASVAERAGVSIGTLYQYFPDKQAILLAAAEREMRRDLAPRQQQALMRALITFLQSIGGLT